MFRYGPIGQWDGGTARWKLVPCSAVGKGPALGSRKAQGVAGGIVKAPREAPITTFSARRLWHNHAYLYGQGAVGGLGMGVRSRRIPLAVTAAGYVLVLLTGCARVGGAGTDVPVSGSVPASPAAVSGPAIRGTATDTSGRVAAGATVLVTVVLGSSEQAERDAKAIFTLGLGCLDKQGCSAPSARGIVAADGRFAVPVPHGQTDKDGLEVTVEAARGTGATVSTTLLLPASALGGAHVSVPLAARPAVLKVTGHHAALQPPAVAGASAAGETVEMDKVGASGTASGTESDVSSGFDIRMLEDGRAMLISRQSGTVDGLPAQFAASLVVTGHAIPPSRGAACSVEDSRGGALPQRPCGLTNGALDQMYWPLHDDPACDDGPCPGTIQNEHRDVVILLPKPIDATLLVVRGCGFTCRVQVSADGKHFSSFSGPSSDTTDTTYAQVLPGLPVAAVRIETATGGFFDSLRQVSVFG